MKYKIAITAILFIFSFLYLKNGVYFLRENDILMKKLREKQLIYNQKPVDAIITQNTMIPGIKGMKINLNKSYQRMKGINEFKESLLIFDEINPNKSIKNVYDKVIISGNLNINKISILTKLNNDYCFTEGIIVDKNCQNNNKYTIHIEKITNNYLTKVKEQLRNGIIFYLDIKNDDELGLIIKYIKNNNYKIVSINELITE